MIGEPVDAEDLKEFQMTLGDMLDRAVRRQGQREAIVFPVSGVRLTYTEFGSMVDETAKALIALGIQKGEHIAIWSPTTPYWLYLQYAAGEIQTTQVRSVHGYLSFNCDGEGAEIQASRNGNSPFRPGKG